MDNDKFIEIATSYVGTPFVNGGGLKGAGVDCCTLSQLIYEEYTGNKYPVQKGYSADWFCKKDCEEIMLPYLQKHCEQVDELQIGDIITYRWGRAKYAHQSIYLGDNKVIHCKALDRVEITDFDNPYFYDGKGQSRITGYWRVK